MSTSGTFQMKYTVIHFDGRIQQNVDMLEFIKQERGCFEFRHKAGTALLAPQRVTYSQMGKMNWLERSRVVTEYGELYNFCNVHWLHNCHYVVEDGFGRIVHPDVFVRAFLERYPLNEKRLESDVSDVRVFWTQDGWAYRSYKTFWGYKRSAGGNRHTTGGKKRMMQYKDNVRAQYTEDGVRIPSVRVGVNDKDFISDFIYWDHNRRFYSEERNWKHYRKTQYKTK